MDHETDSHFSFSRVCDSFLTKLFCSLLAFHQPLCHPLQILLGYRIKLIHKKQHENYSLYHILLEDKDSILDIQFTLYLKILKT